MAKFCGNCGMQLDDTAKVCGRCGAPLAGAPANVSGINYKDPQKQKKIKKIIKLAATLIVIIVAVVIVISVVLQYTGCNGLIRKVMNAYENYDIDTLLSLSSDIYYYREAEWVENYFEDQIGYNIDSFESSVGHNYKLSYEIEEIYEASGRKTEDILNNISYIYDGFDIGSIEEITIAELMLTAKQGERSVSRNLTITLAKENGTWKLLYIE